MTHANVIDLTSQENKNYDNQHDQQLMPNKHDGGQANPYSTTGTGPGVVFVAVFIYRSLQCYGTGTGS